MLMELSRRILLFYWREGIVFGWFLFCWNYSCMCESECMCVSLCMPMSSPFRSMSICSCMCRCTSIQNFLKALSNICTILSFLLFLASIIHLFEFSWLNFPNENWIVFLFILIDLLYGLKLKNNFWMRIEGVWWCRAFIFFVDEGLLVFRLFILILLMIWINENFI